MAEKEKDELEVMNEALSKSEQFVEKYRKPLLIGLIAVIAVIAGFFAVKHLYLNPREKEASAFLYEKVEKPFEKMLTLSDSAKLAAVDQVIAGAQEVADEYGRTKAGKLAKIYMGLAYYEKGEYETAIEYLSKFKAKDDLLAPALSAKIGDCMVNMEKYDDAVPYFEEAAKKAANEVFSPIYLRKAATVYEKLGKKEEALKCYQEIESKYPVYYEDNGIVRYTERAKNM